MHPLIHDWNAIDAPALPEPVMLDDETLRDGLQSPSVRTPDIDQKIRILHLIDRLGIDTADIGLPGAGPHVAQDVERLAREIVDARLSVRANCAARTLVADIVPIAEISQRTGLAIEACTFIGSSPIRQYAEDWTLDRLQRMTEEAVSFAVKEGLPVMYVTEDTTRADPQSLRILCHGRHSRRRHARLHRGHGRSRDAARRGGRGEVRALGGGGVRGRRRRGLARPSRSGSGDREQPGRDATRAPRGCTAPRSAWASAWATRRWISCS